jgi:hypothetical protein
MFVVDGQHVGVGTYIKPRWRQRIDTSKIRPVFAGA